MQLRAMERKGTPVTGEQVRVPKFSAPSGAATDGAQDLLISDTGNDRLRVVAGRNHTTFGITMTQGDIYTAAGNGTTDNTSSGASASATQLSQPDDVVVDVSGNVLTTDTGNNEVRVEANATGTFWGVAMTSGDVYTLAGNGTSGYSGDGGVSTSSVLDYPTGLTLDSSGNVVISDTENDIVRVVAKSNGTYFGIGMTAGHIYRIAGNLNFGYSGNGSSATAATLGLPTGVAIDASGNLIMADTYNSALRVVANTNGTYYGVAMTAGDIYTIAGTGSPGYSGDGSAATSATMSLPSGVTIDGAGNILVSDSSNNVIRVVADSTGNGTTGVAMTAGDIYTIAGTGSQGYSGDGTAATSVRNSATRQELPWTVRTMSLSWIQPTMC